MLVVQGHMIRKYGGRADLHLYVDDARKDEAMATTSGSNQWLDAVAFWIGKVAAGQHNVHLQSSRANAWGCKKEWPVPVRACVAMLRIWELPLKICTLARHIQPVGPRCRSLHSAVGCGVVCGCCRGDLEVLVLPQGPTVQVYQVPDTRNGCPAAAAANAALIQKDFSVTVKSTVLARAHMIRNAAGDADLFLAIDGAQKDRTRTYSQRKDWHDSAVFWVGQVAAGEHSVKVYSDKANVWGCRSGWGDLDVLVLHEGQQQTPCPPSLYLSV